MFYRDVRTGKAYSIFILIFGLFAVNAFGQNAKSDKIQVVPCSQVNQLGGGIGDTKLREGSGVSTGDTGSYGGTFENKPKEIVSSKNKPLQIISKPQPQYTDEAKRNCVQGSVILKVTFFANGSVGNIKVLSGLFDGLTEKAIEAAKKIKFKPEIKNGKPITIVKAVTYNFTIY